MYAKCSKNENESCHVIELAEIQFKIVNAAMTTAGNESLSLYLSYIYLHPGTEYTL